MMRHFCSLAGAGALALVLTSLAIDVAEARKRDRGHGHAQVCSRYSGQCISGPVRTGRNGYEVRMPGGTWIECRGDCRNTLREETIDFFETLRERAPDGWR